ncbi:MAG: sigma factor [Umezawaea sp.]
MRSDLAPTAPPPDSTQSVLDESSLLTLYESTAARLHRYVARRVGADTAEDVVSEAFLVLWDQRAGQGFETDALRAWLYGVATNLLRRHVRAEERKLRAWSREHTARTPVGDFGDEVSTLAAPPPWRVRWPAGWRSCGSRSARCCCSPRGPS